jgi:hypothetical protein
MEENNQEPSDQISTDQESNSTKVGKLKGPKPFVYEYEYQVDLRTIEELSKLDEETLRKMVKEKKIPKKVIAILI